MGLLQTEQKQNKTLSNSPKV